MKQLLALMPRVRDVHRLRVICSYCNGWLWTERWLHLS